MPNTYQPGQKIDHYEIVHKLGHGGMNHVYLAKDIHNQQEVVLKIPNEALLGNIAVFERYKREAEIGSRLNHPHIQHLLNADEDHQEQYLVMEYIQGRTLREIMHERPNKRMPPGEAINLIIQACEALAYAHEHGVYHRDMKPENIMVMENGEIKIIDFGIALLEGARRVTWRGLSSLVGTPYYMAPEQLKGERGSASSDIYAIGITLYEMLSGHTPFEEENPLAVINRQVTQDPPSILQFNPDLSPALTTIIMKAIRRDPERRYTTMQEMIHDLRHLDEVKPVEYSPDAPKTGGRYQQAILITLIIIAIFLALIAFGFLIQLTHH